MTAPDKLYFYPLWLRIWHAFNALGIIILIATGLTMQSSTEAIGFNLVINIHNIAGGIVSVSYLLYFFGNMFTPNGRFYLVKFKGFLKRPLKQAYYYAWGMFHGMTSPYPLSEKRKFNPLQKYSYVMVMYIFVPLVIVSGIALFFPEIIVDEIYHLNGVFITAVVHSSMGFLISVFLVVHLYIASIGKSPLRNFKSIITGWHEMH